MRIGNRRGCREKRESFINLTNYGKMDFSFECRGALLDATPLETPQGLWVSTGDTETSFLPFYPIVPPLTLMTSISLLLLKFYVTWFYAA